MSSSVPFQSSSGMLIPSPYCARWLTLDCPTCVTKLISKCMPPLSLDTGGYRYQLGDTYPRYQQLLDTYPGCQGGVAAAPVTQRRWSPSPSSSPSSSTSALSFSSSTSSLVHSKHQHYTRQTPKVYTLLDLHQKKTR